MTKKFRVHNFNAGPSTLPLSVMEEAQAEFLNYAGTGMSFMEMSHRGKEYDAVHNKAISLLKELMGVPDDYEILFIQGGASMQFAMIPMNFLLPGKQCGYAVTGVWAEKAYEEAGVIGNAYIAASTKDTNNNRIPAFTELKYSPKDAYLHLTSNNTIVGTQWHDFPDTGNVPLIVDMSSDILCRPVDVSRFAMIYAGAQKNLGPAGVTIAIIRKDMIAGAAKNLPIILSYAAYAKDNSIYNTPPTFSIYMVAKVLEWVKEQGGAVAMEKRNSAKAKLLYSVIDESNGFYKGHANAADRSMMNVTFRLPSAELDKKFMAYAATENVVGIGGHRSIGGCRVSIYNSASLESCQVLAETMKKFQKNLG